MAQNGHSHGEFRLKRKVGSDESLSSSLFLFLFFVFVFVFEMRCVVLLVALCLVALANSAAAAAAAAAEDGFGHAMLKHFQLHDGFLSECARLSQCGGGGLEFYFRPCQIGMND